MKKDLLALAIAALAMTRIAVAQTAARLPDFDVSDGKIEQTADGRLAVSSREMRATLKTASRSQQATVRFTYLGPTPDVSHLGNGEVRHQFGIKLKAQDICNLVYVMWNFDTQKIAVSVKLNPGQRTHEDCLDRGYINNIKPSRWTAPPPVQVRLPHTLLAELQGQQLTVKADAILVWQGILVPEVLAFNGPVGLRSDNAQVAFDFLTPR
jgi:hypothetical protein